MHDFGQTCLEDNAVAAFEGEAVGTLAGLGAKAPLSFLVWMLAMMMLLKFLLGFRAVVRSV